MTEHDAVDDSTDTEPPDDERTDFDEGKYLFFDWGSTTETSIQRGGSLG